MAWLVGGKETGKSKKGGDRLMGASRKGKEKATEEKKVGFLLQVHTGLHLKLLLTKAI